MRVGVGGLGPDLVRRPAETLSLLWGWVTHRCVLVGGWGGWLVGGLGAGQMEVRKRRERAMVCLVYD